uniref:Uncharacterized protein n=1 Tax=Arundo donax TaxID=35708 RepID=A0A0A9ESZ1_ARUDO
MWKDSLLCFIKKFNLPH